MLPLTTRYRRGQKALDSELGKPIFHWDLNKKGRTLKGFGLFYVIISNLNNNLNMVPRRRLELPRPEEH